MRTHGAQKARVEARRSLHLTPLSGEPRQLALQRCYPPRARPIDGSGYATTGTGRPRTRGHIDMGHRPDVPFGGTTITYVGSSTGAGLHTGEIEVIGDDIAGVAVHLAPRVCGAAGHGEVLVSRTVVDLVAGSGFSFEDRGEATPRGIPGEWRLFSTSALVLGRLRISARLDRRGAACVAPWSGPRAWTRDSPAATTAESVGGGALETQEPRASQGSTFTTGITCG
jgi:hypothetical protein